MANKKFLIGQLGRFGDCLYATTVAKQIKTDFPDSHITWAIENKFKSVLKKNPHVDDIWVIESGEWDTFKDEAQKRKLNGQYDELVFTQWVPEWKNYDGTIRSSTFRGYSRPITVSVNPVIRLGTDEIDHVKEFAKRHNLTNYSKVILFECAPNSGQSFVDMHFALTVAELVTKKIDNICFVLSGPNPLSHINPRIIDASQLTFRENAELTKYCTLLIGCSSGITWLSTSDWAKKIDTLQLLTRTGTLYTGLKYDFEYWNISTDNVIEVTLNDVNYVVDCVSCIIQTNFQTAKKQFDEIYKPAYRNFRPVISSIMWCKQKRRFQSIKKVILIHKERNPYLNTGLLTCLSIFEVIKFFVISLYSSNKN